MSADLQSPAFTNEIAAREAIEAVLWPHGPVCPHCGSLDRLGKVDGKSARPGLYYCGECKRQFTVTVGTIFERSKVPLSKWWLAIHLMASSKKGMSAHQLHRSLGVTYQTAWFIMHRLREAMRSGDLAPMGGPGTIIEIDETFIGNKADMPKRRGFAHKHAILSLVERGGKVRSFHVAGTTAAHLVPILRAIITLTKVPPNVECQARDRPVINEAAQLRTVSKGVAQGLVSVISTPTVLLGPPLIGFLFGWTHNFILAFGSIMLFGCVAITASFLAGPALKREAS